MDNLSNSLVALEVVTLDLKDIPAFGSIVQNDIEEMNNVLDTVCTYHTCFFRESKSFKFLDKGCNKMNRARRISKNVDLLS